MQTPFQNNSIFFVDVDKIKPNPFQPRLEFDNAQLESLSESIRMYGVLQPLVVTRKEVFTEEGGMTAQYELIAGERRLRASKLAGMKEVPVVIRSAEQTDQEKLELAIIENLQREDLNPVDRAKAFRLLADDFNLKHAEIGKRVGKSREYVSNSLRLLALPEEMLAALTVKKISEGHARSLLMLGDRPEEQMTLFKEIVLKGLTVRHAEKIARRVAYDKVRKKTRAIDPHVVEVEEEMSEALGTRVHIERKAVGGKIQIDFFSEDDLAKILDVLKQHESELYSEEGSKNPQSKMEAFIEQSGGLTAATGMIFEKEQAEAEAQKTTVEKEVEAYRAPQEDSTPQFSFQPQKEETLVEEVTQQVPEAFVIQDELQESSQEKKGTENEIKESQEEPVHTFNYSDVLSRTDTPSVRDSMIDVKDVLEENDIQEVLVDESLESRPKTENTFSEQKEEAQEQRVFQEIDTPAFYPSQQPQKITLPDIQAIGESPQDTSQEEDILAKEGIEIITQQDIEQPMNEGDQKESFVQAIQDDQVNFQTPEQNNLEQRVVNPDNIQVQSILQNAQTPLPHGQSVQSMAEVQAKKHTDELYYNLPPEAQKTKLDAPIEVATPHYGKQQDDDHLYRV